MTKRLRQFQNAQALDDKGRVLLPAAMRQDLAGRESSTLVLAFNPMSGCIGVYIPEEFERLNTSALEGWDPRDPVAEAFAQLHIANATDVDLDSAGRILIPAFLRERARLGAQVVVHSLADHWEIWDRPAWEAREQDLERNRAQIAADFFRGRRGTQP